MINETKDEYRVAITDRYRKAGRSLLGQTVNNKFDPAGLTSEQLLPVVSKTLQALLP